jgi:hypothetical protein
MKPLFLALLLLLSGCITEQPQKPVVAAPTIDLTVITNAAADAKIKAERERELADKQRQRVAANLDTADTANRGNPDGAPKATTSDAIQLAKVNNGNAQPDPEQLLVGERIARANAEGKAEEAKRLVSDATGQAQQATTELASLRASAQAAQDALSATIQAKDKELEAAKKKAASDLQKLIDMYEQRIAKEKAVNVREQQVGLNRFAAVCLALAVIGIGVGFYLKILANLAPISGLLFLSSCLSFGLSQVVGEPWFKWAMVACICVVGIYILILSWAHAERKKEADVALPLVKQLDAGYEAATDEQKAALDATVFDPLSSKTSGMEKTVKATVLRIKANLKESAKE